MIQTFFNPGIIAASWPIVLAGLRNTVLLSLLVVPLGLAGGLILALLASVKHPAVRWPLMAWVDFFRAFRIEQLFHLFLQRERFFHSSSFAIDRHQLIGRVAVGRIEANGSLQGASRIYRLFAPQVDLTQQRLGAGIVRFASDHAPQQRLRFP